MIGRKQLDRSIPPRDYSIGIERMNPEKLNELYAQRPEDFTFDRYGLTLCNKDIIATWLKLEGGQQLFIQLCLRYCMKLKEDPSWQDQAFQSELLKQLLEHMPVAVPRLDKIGLIDFRGILSGWLYNYEYMTQINPQSQWQYLVLYSDEFVKVTLNKPDVVFKQLSHMIDSVGSYISPDIQLVENIVDAFLQEHEGFNLLKLMRISSQGAKCLQHLCRAFPRFFNDYRLEDIAVSLSGETKHEQDINRLSLDYMRGLMLLISKQSDIKNHMSMKVDVAKTLVAFYHVEVPLQQEIVLFLLKMMTSPAIREKSKWLFQISKLFSTKKAFARYKYFHDYLHHLVQQNIQPLSEELRKIPSVFWQGLYDSTIHKINLYADWQALGGYCFSDQTCLWMHWLYNQPDVLRTLLQHEKIGSDVLAATIFKEQDTSNFTLRAYLIESLEKKAVCP